MYLRPFFKIVAAELNIVVELLLAEYQLIVGAVQSGFLMNLTLER